MRSFPCRSGCASRISDQSTPPAKKGGGRAEDFEAAAAFYQKAIDLSPEELPYRLAFGHFCQAWASWRKEAGLDPRAAVAAVAARRRAALASFVALAARRIMRSAAAVVFGHVVVAGSNS